MRRKWHGMSVYIGKFLDDGVSTDIKRMNCELFSQEKIRSVTGTPVCVGKKLKDNLEALGG